MHPDDKDKLYQRLDAVIYESQAILDYDAKKAVRELVNIIQDILEMI